MPADATSRTEQLGAHLKERLQGQVKIREPLAPLTSLNLGGPAELLVEATEVGDVRIVLDTVRRHNLPLHILGDGTNVLVPDEGVTGIVLRLAGVFDQIEFRENKCIAGAGVSVSRAIAETAKAGLAGLEVLYGVPGSIGGAVYMNAGTRYGWTSGILAEVEMIEEDEVRVLPADDLRLSYRYSRLQDQPGIHIITRATFVLKPEPPEDIKARIAAMSQYRRETQPLGNRSCGCMFKNPEGDSAGRLIDVSGLKGMSVGGASVSDQHANFFINRGDAKASDFYKLARLVQRKIREQTGVELEMEVQLIGDWSDDG